MNMTSDGSATPQFQLELETGDGMVTIRVAGELDLAAVPQFREALATIEAPAPTTVTIDLSGLTFIDSTGLQGLVEAKRRADAEGWTLRMTRPRGGVERTLRLVGLDRQLPLAGE